MCERETVCCDVDDLGLARRGFLKGVAAGAAVTTLGTSASFAADDAVPKEKGPAKPAESLIRELYASLSDEQMLKLVLPWDYGAKGKRGRTPARLGMYNRPFENQRIGENYTKPQQELIDRILRAICNGDEGYRKITRGGRFDTSRSMTGCGVHIFGEPSDDKKYAWLFTGHHLTVRCDGNSMPGAAFGGPIYYGHLAQGYSEGNVYYYQTKRVQTLFDALDEKQQKQAVASGSPGEQAQSVAFRPDGQKRPGIAYANLSANQQKLAAEVMRDVLLPFRKEDGDEVMEIVKANGGMEQIHFGYYKDRRSKDDNTRWHFWRLEGPGFVWNFRVLPHVHCFVNIAAV